MEYLGKAVRELGRFAFEFTRSRIISNRFAFDGAQTTAKIINESIWIVFFSTCAKKEKKKNECCKRYVDQCCNAFWMGHFGDAKMTWHMPQKNGLNSFFFCWNRKVTTNSKCKVCTVTEFLTLTSLITSCVDRTMLSLSLSLSSCSRPRNGCRFNWMLSVTIWSSKCSSWHLIKPNAELWLVGWRCVRQKRPPNSTSDRNESVHFLICKFNKSKAVTHGDKSSPSSTRRTWAQRRRERRKDRNRIRRQQKRRRTMFERWRRMMTDRPSGSNVTYNIDHRVNSTKDQPVTWGYHTHTHTHTQFETKKTRSLQHKKGSKLNKSVFVCWNRAISSAKNVSIKSHCLNQVQNQKATCVET